jgi:hypothetical protein
MKKVKNEKILIENYVQKLDKDAVRFLALKFVNNSAGDKAEVANFLARDREIDAYLKSASSCTEWFDMMDLIKEKILEAYQLVEA